MKLFFKSNKYYITTFILLLISITSTYAFFIDQKEISRNFNVSNTVTASFYTQGGTSVKSISKYPGKKLGTLPIPTKDNYEFVEWNTSADGLGEKVTEDTILISDVTYYAK